MGSELFLTKFENGVGGEIPMQEMSGFIEKYGRLVETDDGKKLQELVLSDPIGECVLLHHENGNGIGCISISRPRESKLIKPFIFEAMQRFNIVFCDVHFERGYTAVDLSDHLPEGSFPDGIVIVNNADELW